MTDILIQCPRTRLPVSTGLKAEWVLLSSLPRAILSRCPDCGGTHRWKPEDAWIGPPNGASGDFRAKRSAVAAIEGEADSQRTPSIRRV